MLVLLSAPLEADLLIVHAFFFYDTDAHNTTLLFLPCCMLQSDNFPRQCSLWFWLHFCWTHKWLKHVYWQKLNHFQLCDRMLWKKERNFITDDCLLLQHEIYLLTGNGHILITLVRNCCLIYYCTLRSI